LGLGLIYLTGLTYLWFYFRYIAHVPRHVSELLWLGLLPFIPGDLAKAVLASCLAGRLGRLGWRSS